MSRTNSGRTGAFALLLGSALTIGGLVSAGIARADDATPTTTPTAPAANTPVAQPAAAPAAPATPAVGQKLVVSGLVDGYFNYDFHNPTHLGSNNIVTGLPIYNFRSETPTLALAELNLVYAPAATGGFGAKGTFITGDTADINHGAQPGGYGANTTEARYKNVQQLYVTWAFPKGGAVDFGKFYTPFGYEVTESNANFNYSRSVVFTDLLPFYHAGLRVTSPLIGKGLTLTGYVVNSINDTGEEGVHDDNGAKGYIGSINWTDPAGKYTLVETYGYSQDKGIFTPLGSADAQQTGNVNTTLSDTDVTWNLNSTNTIGLNYTYRKDDLASELVNDGDDTLGGHVTDNGYAAYYRNQLTKTTALALRYSQVQVTDDSTLILNDELRGNAAPGTPHNINPEEITATYEIKSGSSWLTRFEYRHDWANIPLYANSNDVVTAKSQDLATVGVVYTFGG